MHLKIKWLTIQTLMPGKANTEMCLSIGTPETINIPFVLNITLIIFRCPKITLQPIYKVFKFRNT